MAKFERRDSWNEWHRVYEDQDSELYQRMLACRREVLAGIDERPPGAVTSPWSASAAARVESSSVLSKTTPPTRQPIHPSVAP